MKLPEWEWQMHECTVVSLMGTCGVKWWNTRLEYGAESEASTNHQEKMFSFAVLVVTGVVSEQRNESMK